MKVQLSVSDDFEVGPDGREWYCATLFASKKAARDDQTVLGSSWEAPSDMDTAYACLGPVCPDGDTDDLIRRLKKAGYKVEEID